MSTKWGWAAFALTASAMGCSSDETYEASLDDARGLAEGAGVFVAGVRVGEVKDVRVSNGRAIVELVVESDHDIELHDDACVLAVRHDGTPALLLEPGDDGDFDEDRIPTCSTESLLDGMRARLEKAVDTGGAEAGRAAGRFLREATLGFREGIGDAREVGRNIGETTGELGEGVREGLEESTNMSASTGP